jgi:hypothetical protein
MVAPKVADSSASSSKGKKRAVSADDIQVSGVNVNKSTDMGYWTSQASANELRSQIMFRKGGHRMNYGRKDRKQFLEIVRGMIADGSG